MSGITVIPWIEFLSCSYGNNKEIPSLNDALIIGKESQLSNWPAVNLIKCLEDLKEVRRRYFSRPLILLVECGKHVPIGQRLNNQGDVLGPSDLEWWLTPSSAPWNESTYQPGGLTAEEPRSTRFLRVKFAVLIDTSHPNIQRQLEDGFRRAEAFLISEKLFYLEFDFNAVILSWWMKQGPQDWLKLDCLDTAYSIGGRVSLTNTGEPCHGLRFGIWWSLCLPCYFILAIPYKVWRNVLCQIWDHRVIITGTVKAISSIQNVPIRSIQD